MTHPAPQNTVPFESAEEAWFWFIAAQQARCEGARVASGQSLYPRPCEPIDILKVLDSLYRKRRLLRDHLLVLRHYGRRHMPPDPHRIKEARAYKLWIEALDRMGEVFVRKGIIESAAPWPQSSFLFGDNCQSYGVAAE
ncbi:MAG: hypothetical protein ACPGRX_00920 [Bdellovibrionales bacterium]